MAVFPASSTGGELPAIEARYRQLLVDRFDRLTFKGISRSGKAVSLPLEDVYVELKSVVDVPDAADSYSADERRVLLEAGARGMHEDDMRRQLDSLRVERRREEGRRGEARLVRRSIEDAVAEPGRPGLVILGDPGSGKSTLLHYLALRAAKEGLREAAGEAPQHGTTLRSEKGKPRLPILVPLAAYDDWVRCDHGKLSLGEFLPFYYEKWSSFSGLAPLFHQAFDEGRALVLLDGLDEVLDVGTRRHIADQARALIQVETPRGNRFVVTSRFVGYREASLSGNLPEVSVLDFGEEEIASFAHKWCEAFEIWFAGDARTDTALQSAAKEERALLAEVRVNPSVLRLAANPLLLTMLSLLRRQAGGKLPNERVKLYKQYVDMLLDNNWETVRNDGARTREPVRFDRNLASNYLIELALWLQRHKPSGTARRKDLEWALENIALRTDGFDPKQASANDRAQAHEKAELFLKDMRHFAGILAERGRDAFGFLHLTFQEYFAGRALARMEPEERWGILKGNLHLPRWREPLLLCAGQLGLIERRTRAVSDLGRKVLAAGSPHEEMLHRDVLLVAAIASDGVGLERGLLDDLAQRLMALSDGPLPAVRAEALAGLAKLALFEHGSSVTWWEERIRRGTRSAEIGWALESVISADSCAGLRRALGNWLSLPIERDLGVVNAVMLRAALTNDTKIRDLVLAMSDDIDESARYHSIRVLGALVANDEEVRRRVLPKLDDPSVTLRETAVRELGALVGSNEEVRQLILAKLDDTSEYVRQAAVDALRALVANDEEVHRLILTKLDDPGRDVRVAAVSALGSLVANDEKVRQLIIAKLDDASAKLREAAVAALGTLVARDEDVCHRVLATLDDAAGNVRQAAISALRTVLASNAQAHDRALEGLGHNPCPVLQHMIESLNELSSYDVETRRLMLAKLDNSSNDVRGAAIGALGALVASDEEVRRLILAKLDDISGHVRGAAVGTLGALVASDEEVRNLVLAKLDDTSEYVRQAAVGALKMLVANDEEVRRLVLPKLDDPSASVRGTVVDALGALVAADEEVRRLVLPKLDDPYRHIRRAAVGALGALAASDEEVRRLILLKLNDSSGKRYDGSELMRMAAVGALGALVGSDKEVRHLVLARLDDTSEFVRGAAVGALGALVTSDEEVRNLVLAKLDDRSFRVRAAAVNELAPLVHNNMDLRERFLEWLGAVGEYEKQPDSVRRRLAIAYAPLLALEPELRARVVAMLHSPAWPTRKGAAWALIAMPGGPPPELLPVLRGLLKDRRGEESWPERLETSALLINDRDPRVSQSAIAVTLEALDYATQPWYGLNESGSYIRTQAAMVLGTLQPAYRDEGIFVRLTRVLREDDKEDVRDAAYKALLVLAVSPEAEFDMETIFAAPPDPSQAPLSPTSLIMSPLPRSLVLHLSDLHFGTAENAVTWSSQLAEDLSCELTCSRLDAVILSGDIANKSTTDEYAAARLFLEKLLGEFQVSKDQVILVPGNHDLNWGLARKGYKLTEREDCPGDLEEGRFINLEDGAVRLRDDALYTKRFEPFAAFYEDVCGKPYPLAPTEQAILYPLPAQRLLLVGLNSAWELDHHFKTRASINEQALSRALDQIRATPAYKDFLRIAVWHHPVNSPYEDRIKNHGFLERLANADFRLGLHGHIHKAQTNLYPYDLSPTGRRVELVCAGTFGAPTRELVPGYPFQYQLLRFEGSTLTVETRRREEVHGTWKPDSRWTTERGKDPAPRYEIKL